MDANGLTSFQIATSAGFGFTRSAETAPRDLQWKADKRLMRLARRQQEPQLAEDETFARAQVEKPSPVCDRFGSHAWWDPDAHRVVAGGFAPGSVPLPIPPDAPVGVPQPTDMAFGPDDVLYLARNDAVVMSDQRGRWRPARVTLAGFDAHRLAPAAGGGAWALDRTNGRLAHLTGYPLRTSGIEDRGEESFHPKEPNPKPPRLRLISGAVVPEGHDAVAIAASEGGKLALLAWRLSDDAVLFTLEDGKLVRRFALAGLQFPYALAWTGETGVAVLANEASQPARQAFVYDLDAPPSEEAEQAPTGAVYPLLEPWHGGFFNVLSATPSYPTASGAPDRVTGQRPLHALSRAKYARSGSVTLGPFDSGEAGCVWHRLYLEASIPQKAGLRLWAFASDNGGLPPPPGADGAPVWALHTAGAAAALPGHPDAPRAAWLGEPSEMAFDSGLLSCPSEPDRSGLFTLLLQRPGRAVRRVRGQYLFLHLELIGDSQVTPEIAATRIYYKRFSYRDRYLPALYGETLDGPDADAGAAATPPDFLERFLGLFEGPLTQIEDKIANSWQLTDPAAAPDSALPWLAQWIGVDPGAAETPERLRQTLLAAPWTARLHGTTGGILAALELATGGFVVRGGQIDRSGVIPRPGEIALASREGETIKALMLSTGAQESGAPTVFVTGGAVTGGEIVLVEGFRLRRSFATILGADLADEDDPLTLGLTASGNSFVGDTLILGDETRREFMALFSAELPQSWRDRWAVAQFFERLAFRQMILVRRSSRTADLSLIHEIAAKAAPAHVETTVLEASRPLIVAAASLVGIDTYLVDDPGPGKFRLNRSPLGLGDQVRGAGMLDPRANGPVSAPPQAAADGPARIWLGSDFILSAARSRAAEGRRIVRNIWMWR